MGRQCADLAGRRFGHLTVIRRAMPHEAAHYRNKAVWACTCDCGSRNVLRTASALRGVSSSSCGCVRKVRRDVGLVRPQTEAIRTHWDEVRTRRDAELVGQVFGELRALGPVPGSKSRSPTYRFMCSCGRAIVARLTAVVSGHTRSCGHLRRASHWNGRYVDVAGQRFGHLFALGRVDLPTAGQGTIWLFRCVCGQLTTKRLKDVRSGNTASCGCQQRRGGTPQLELVKSRDRRSEAGRARSATGEPLRENSR